MTKETQRNLAVYVTAARSSGAECLVRPVKNTGQTIPFSTPMTKETQRNLTVYVTESETHAQSAINVRRVKKHGTETNPTQVPMTKETQRNLAVYVTDNGAREPKGSSQAMAIEIQNTKNSELEM